MFLKNVRFRYEILIVCLLFFILSILFSYSLKLPTITPDELGYLAAAQYMATGFALNMNNCQLYNPGASFFYAPAYLLTDDIFFVYQWVHIVNAFFYAAMFPFLLLLGRSIFGLSLKKSYLFSCIVMLYPGLSFLSRYAACETIFSFFFILLIFLTQKLFSSPKITTALLAGAVAGSLNILHVRGLLVAVLFAALLITAAFTLNKRALFGLPPLAAAVWLSETAMQAIRDALYDYGRLGKLDVTGRLLGNIKNLKMWPDMIGMFTGHALYLFLATLGLGIWGYAMMARRIRFKTPEGLISFFFIVLLPVCMGASVVTLANEISRGATIYMHARYFDFMTPFLVMAALARLSKKLPIKHWHYYLVAGLPLLLCSGYLFIRSPGLWLSYDYFTTVFFSSGLNYLTFFQSPNFFLSNGLALTLGLVMVLFVLLARHYRCFWTYGALALLFVSSSMFIVIQEYAAEESLVQEQKVYYTVGQMVSEKHITAEIPEDLFNTRFLYYMQMYSNIRLVRTPREFPDLITHRYAIVRWPTPVPLDGEGELYWYDAEGDYWEWEGKIFTETEGDPAETEPETISS